MKELFFDFSFENWTGILVSFIPALLNLGIFIYVLFFVGKSTLSSIFLFFVFFLFMWQMEETMLRICVSEECARVWNRMFSMSTGFVTAAGLHFILCVVNKRKQENSFLQLMLIYFPNFLFSFLFISDIAYSNFVYTDHWGWVYEPQNFVSKAGLIWMLLQGLLMVILLVFHAFKLRKSKSIQYKQILILVIGVAVPTLFGFLYQGLLPIFFNLEPIPLASALVVCFSFSSVVSITKYDLFEYSPYYQWSDIVESMNEGIAIVDNNDLIQYVNNNFSKMLGYSSVQLVGKCMHGILVSEDSTSPKNKIIEKSKRIFRDKYEVVMQKMDGSGIVCEINAQPYLDADRKVIGSVGIYTDITKQKEAAIRIRESESRYRSFIEHASDGIFLSDQQGNFIDVNHKVCQMLGYGREEFLCLNISDMLFEEDIQSSPLSVDQLMQGKSLLAVRNIKQKGGFALAVEINSRMLPDGKILGIVRDITERKKTAEDLLEKVNEMDAFIYRASHDLRGPLASITGLTNLAKEEIENRSAHLYFDKINDSVKRLDDILQELSKIARVTQAKIEPSVVDIKKEVIDILESLKHLPNYPKIKFELEVNIQSIFCDRILLILVLQNLLINSIHYIDETKEKSFIKLKANETDSGIEILVADNGLGIAVDIQDKVFDMFYRGTNASKGSGLGLYIVKNALKKLNGTVQLTSKEREGTSVLLSIYKIEKSI